MRHILPLLLVSASLKIVHLSSHDQYPLSDKRPASLLSRYSQVSERYPSTVRSNEEDPFAFEFYQTLAPEKRPLTRQLSPPTLKRTFTQDTTQKQPPFLGRTLSSPGPIFNTVCMNCGNIHTKHELCKTKIYPCHLCPLVFQDPYKFYTHFGEHLQKLEQKPK